MARIMSGPDLISEDSIWQNLTQSAFRKKVQKLKEKSEIPGDHKKHSEPEWTRANPLKAKEPYTLPFEVERGLVDGLAFIVAVPKDVRTIAAVALEEGQDSQPTIVRLAVNGTIRPEVKYLTSMLDLLQKCARRRLSMESCMDQLTDQMLDLCRNSIHARLQSKLWKRPPYLKSQPLKPLNRELRKLISPPSSTALKHYRDVSHLCSLYKSVEACKDDPKEEKKLLKNITRLSDEFCTQYRDRREFSSQPFKQVNKIGKYWSVCQRLVDASRLNRRVFGKITLGCLKPYPAASYPGKGPCHVHAEIQLLAFYALQAKPSVREPRVIGVSKSCCYLCNLFIHHYGRFFISRTHGRLYDQWNVPDVFQGIANRQQLLKVRAVLSTINTHLEAAFSAPQKRGAQHPFPMESDRSLPTGLPRPSIPPDAGTLASGESRSTVTATPLTLPNRSLLPNLPTTPAFPPPDAPKAASNGALVLRSESQINVARPLLDHKVSPLSRSNNDHSANPSLSQAGVVRMTVGSSSHPASRSNGQDSGAVSPSRHHNEDSEASVPLTDQDRRSLSLDSSQDHGAKTELPSEPQGPSPSSSSFFSGISSIDSQAFPIECPITSSSQIHSTTGNLSLTIEIEAPAKGLVQLRRIMGHVKEAESQVVDIGKMAPGEEMHFSRDNESDKMGLILQHPGQNGVSTGLSLNWR